MIKTKRGASETIIFVLLIGFTIATAIIVITWSTKHTKELTETGIEFVEKNIECDKVGINVKDISEDEDCSQLEIKNKGYLKIDKLITRSTDDNKIEVTPIIIIKENNRNIGCKKKSVVLNCDGILSSNINTLIHNIDLAPNDKTSETTEGKPIDPTFVETSIFEDFENEIDCTTSCSISCNLISTKWSNIIGDNTDWISNSGGTPSYNTGPSGDHTTGNGHYVYIESSWPCYPYKTAYLVSSVIDTNIYSDLNLNFWYHMYGNYMGSLYVEVSEDGGSTWNNEWSISGNQGNLWHEATVDLSKYAGKNSVKIRFKAITGKSYQSDIAVDDITITASS
jgi:hypothetical protein